MHARNTTEYVFVPCGKLFLASPTHWSMGIQSKVANTDWNSLAAAVSFWWLFQQPCGNPLTPLTGAHRLRMGSCLARFVCLKLCYGSVTFRHPWRPFGPSFSWSSATAAQVFQSREVTDPRSQGTSMLCCVTKAHVLRPGNTLCDI